MNHIDNNFIFPLYAIATNTLSKKNPDRKQINAGDTFNYYMLNRLSGGYYTEFARDGPGYIHSGDRFMFVGSIATDSTYRSILCGVGIIEKEPRKIKDFKECYGVRGKYTLDSIKKCKPEYDTSNVVLGDPGLLLPLFVRNTEKIENKKYKYGLILHLIDRKYIENYFDIEFLKNILIIDIETDNFDKLTKDIYQCEVIISSSLHGLIFANSFHKPSIYVNLVSKKLGKSMPDDNIKFYDYYSIFSIDESLIENKVDYVINNENINKLKVIKLDSNEIIINQYRLYNNIINIFKKYNFKLSNLYSNNIVSSLSNIEDKYSIKLMCDMIVGDKQFQIARLGGCECNIVNYLLQQPIDFDDKNLKIIPNSKTINAIKKGIHIDFYMKSMIINSGYYDINNDYNILIEFANNILSLIKTADLITIGGVQFNTVFMFYGEFLNSFDVPILKSYEPLCNLIKNKIVANYSIIENFTNFHLWFPMLDKKKILIVSPFTKEIKKQLNIKDKIFTNNTTYNNNLKDMNYPEYEKVEFVTMPLTTNMFSTPHKNIIETDKELCKEIKEKDFDICLLMAGAHTYNIQKYIVEELNKSTIHLGGCGQLLFGIKGPRYITHYFSQLMNNHWIYPEKIVKSSYDKNDDRHKGDSLSAYFKDE